MCAIYGAIGNVHQRILKDVQDKAKDRGRDGGRMEQYNVNGVSAFLGNWRAAPTTEMVEGKLQPYDGLVHNGTVANDKELGGLALEIDSEVLSRVLVRNSLYAWTESVKRVVGSFAMAAVSHEGILAAVNYKPLHWARYDGAVYFASMAHHLEMLRQVSPVQRVEPYSTLLWTAHGGLTVGKLPLEQPLDALVVASGGLDSTVAAAKLVRQGRRVCLLHFHYGCRAQEREWARVVLIGAELGADVAVITLPDVFGRHGLNGEDHITAGVAGSEYAHEWVPARNLVMLSTAVAYAEAHGFGSVALGNNLEEAGAYPDNEEQFILDMDRAVQLATQNGRRVRIVQPVGHLMKHEIVKLGLELKAPLEHTWSCYRGGERHCGECGPCFMRRTAFERNGAKDPVMP